MERRQTRPAVWGFPHLVPLIFKHEAQSKTNLVVIFNKQQ
jgi:hypothetical protein